MSAERTPWCPWCRADDSPNGHHVAAVKRSGRAGGCLVTPWDGGGWTCAECGVSAPRAAWVQAQRWQAAADAMRDRERARAEAAEAEVARLRAAVDESEGQRMEMREAMRRQAAAVRMASVARATIDAHDQATLRSLAGQDRAALIEELAAARRERDDWNARATSMEFDRDAARADAAALRAIVEGRTAPPTDEEIEAHAAAGGVWLVTRRSGFGRAIAYDSDEARRLATWPDTRWWALDATGRPCAWPTGGA